MIIEGTRIRARRFGQVPSYNSRCLSQSVMLSEGFVQECRRVQQRILKTSILTSKAKKIMVYQNSKWPQMKYAVLRQSGGKLWSMRWRNLDWQSDLPIIRTQIHLISSIEIWNLLTETTCSKFELPIAKTPWIKRAHVEHGKWHTRAF